MATSSTPTVHELNLKDLPTSSVVLYPSRAHVTRAINDIFLRPGSNQIEIYGLTPTADEHSIKVDGAGAASISDMTVDLVENKENFHDFYPEDSESEDESDSESEDEDEKLGRDAKAIKDELEQMRQHLERTDETKTSILKRLNALDKYSNKLDPEHSSSKDVVGALDMYKQQRADLYRDMEDQIQKEKDLHKAIAKKEKEMRLATKAMRVADRRVAKEKQKDKEKKERQRQDKRKLSRLARQERRNYWPTKVYKVTLTLEVGTDTPGTSRRSSMSSITLAKAPTGIEYYDGPERTVSLSLSYVTESASWSPRYDINFSTVNKTGMIVYRAEFTNHTSETWTDAKISLSTSQASFRGLGDSVPWLHPWNISLSKGPGHSALQSHSEIIMSRAQQQHGSAQSKNRNELFALGEMKESTRDMDRRARKVPPPPPAPQSNFNTFGSNSFRGGALFGSTQQAPQAYNPPQQSLFANHSNVQNDGVDYSLDHDEAEEGASHVAMALRAPSGAMRGGLGAMKRARRAQAYDPTIEDAPDFAMEPTGFDDQEPTWEDHGLTTTYEIPGARTLVPATVARRHKIASLPFSNLLLTSIAVPKLRSAAFLRARFRNPSNSLTLLRGTAGLTLDSTFLGNTTLPRVSPGELITLPLGVDPAVHISYAKPTVKRSTQGIFNKEATQIFSRSILITNTKNLPIELLVLDQVPVSEDEKLRVDVVLPNGLRSENDAVRAGEAAKDSEKKWGSSKATLKKNGEIRWDVKLEKGCSCRLPLEYETKAPGSDVVVTK